ncbi:MAG: hypothetical protein HY399_06285 [Elusimicrobia bacterium]|nr:hypothetical protein [Elusimicrobiota bacterium]
MILKNSMQYLGIGFCLCFSFGLVIGQEISALDQLKSFGDSNEDIQPSQVSEPKPTFVEEPAQKQALPPPQTFSKEQIDAWILEEIQKANSRMEYKLRETEEWSNYVNFHHYVSLTYDGVPEGYRFNFNWPAQLDKQTRIKTVPLPLGEVTETGKLMFWKDSCNFYELTSSECKSSIHTIVTHEARHFTQWQTLAGEAIQKITGEKLKNPPMNIEELSRIPGARETFMSKWAAGPHYQCREVEVYSTQASAGEASKEFIKQSIELLAAYYKGCKNSQWKDDFEIPLGNMEAIFQTYGFTPH